MPDDAEIVTYRPALDTEGLAALGRRWCRLEAAASPSPFQTWAWVGCLAAERFADPVLVEARDAQGTLGLSLWNRRPGRLGRTLHLHESGDKAFDAVFTEHNDPLLARRVRDPSVLLARMLAAARNAAPRLALSGVQGVTLGAAGRVGAVLPGPDRGAPYVDLAAIPPGTDYAAQLSRNTRQQLLRSDRAYAARGALRIERAETPAEAARFLDALIVLHDRTWVARGKPGAFAGAEIRRFHRALIGRGAPDMVELLRISAGAEPVGYLYNLVRGGWACAYQSGFDYDRAGPHQKPGLTCHHLAIAAHRARGGTCYDFLGGADRYKRSLANAERTLHWFGVAPAWHPAALLARMREALRR